MFNTLRYLRSAGFTMIELLVVIAVIGVLAVAVLSSINPIEQINKGRDTRSRSDAAQLISAVDRYFAIHEKYPWNEDGLTGPADTFMTGWTYESDGAVSGIVSPPVGSDTGDYRSKFVFDETLATSDNNVEWAWIMPLVTTAEVKEAYGNRIAKVADNTDFLVTKPEGANSTMYVCFNPSSYAFDMEASARCDDTVGGTGDSQLQTDVPDACPSVGGVRCTSTLNDEIKCLVCLP